MIDIWSIYQNLMLITLLFDHGFQSKLYQSHYAVKSTFETKISLRKTYLVIFFESKLNQYFFLNIWLISIHLNLFHMVWSKFDPYLLFLIWSISFFLQIYSLLFVPNLIIIFWSKFDQFPLIVILYKKCIYSINSLLNYRIII